MSAETFRSSCRRVAFAVSALAFARPALADPPPPALPPGFVSPGPTWRKPTVRKTGQSSLQHNHEFTFSSRSALPGARADIAALPVTAIEPADLLESPAQSTVPPGGPGDLVVLKAVGEPRLSIQGFDAGVLRLGRANPTATGRQSAGGIPKACGPKAKGTGVTAFSYEALRRADDQGGVELVMARGYFDTASCRLAVTRRLAAHPAHLGGGILYAFKTRCEGCGEGARDVLHVLTPQREKGKFAIFVPFEHHRLPLARGVSAAFGGTTGPRSTSFNDWTLPDWDGLVKRQCLVDKTFCFTDVRFEVSWGMGEPSPTAFLAGDFLATRAPDR